MNERASARLDRLVHLLKMYAGLKEDRGARGVNGVIEAARRCLEERLEEMKRLPEDASLARCEPDGLAEIRNLRPPGPRRMSVEISGKEYAARLEGALLGRMAGCTLGSPVEAWSMDKMRLLAQENDQPFPPVEYWKRVPGMEEERYLVSRRKHYTLEGMDGVPADDDIAYTLLGLLILEEYGPSFTTEDVGEAWKKYLDPSATYTAERVALENLLSGIPAGEAAVRNNPYVEWIGASIRADPWGYVAAGRPERAAAMAYADAYLTHRRGGIYGEMYFAAAVAAAFTVTDPMEALHVGLSEIPADCRLAAAVRWALAEAAHVRDYVDARRRVDERFPGMHHAHTINNACLVIFGIALGGRDFTRVIGETVAMGLDNDCTAATAGSIVGAVVGKEGIPSHWYEPFGDTVHTYLRGARRFRITDLLRRFVEQSRRVHRVDSVEKP